MSIWWTAMIFGLAGSIHCAGMCGPIALMFSSLTARKSVVAVLYNAGRAITYGVLGLISGLIGSAIFMGGGQQALSIVGGSIILIVLLLSQINIPFLRKVQEPIQCFVRTKLSALYKRKNASGVLGVGLLNGLLPCGLVYAAVGGAAATGNVWQGGLYMIIFALGTMPVMLTLSLIGTRLSGVVHRKLNKVIPYTIAVMAILLIMRGANLGIPYFSPKVEKQEVACCHRK
jgi:sulfite exporter TauE/SafE